MTGRKLKNSLAIFGNNVMISGQDKSSDVESFILREDKLIKNHSSII